MYDEGEVELISPLKFNKDTEVEDIIRLLALEFKVSPFDIRSLLLTRNLVIIDRISEGKPKEQES